MYMIYSVQQAGTRAIKTHPTDEENYDLCNTHVELTLQSIQENLSGHIISEVVQFHSDMM